VELSVLVSDTGIGIPKNALKRIFDLFETQTGDNALAKTTNSGVSSASGIGLTICKELVDAMGGSLSVQSTLGMGSTFEFKLNTLVRRARVRGGAHRRAER
jgi:two-component system sensor histidine kinase EvgS